MLLVRVEPELLPEDDPNSLLVKSNLPSNPIDGESVVVFKHLTNHLNVLLRHRAGWATRTLPTLGVSCVFDPLSEPPDVQGRGDPALGNLGILFPEPPTDSGRARQHAILEDNLLQLGLSKEALRAGHYLK